ncbi:MAG: TIGR03557 family F420-dependent LLM class oxidoreductase [Chloroflexi bacterium]|nr:TIGR03557 family F420-dependent LLM class oxidoreductase [Chloroflexota bacterium]
MTIFGYALSSEEHTSRDLVRHAALAEEAGFEFALISDHFHPWLDDQGHSPFVWSVLGGISRETTKLEIGTGVTAPIIRTHPAIIAHAAATTGEMFEGRFFLGVGTGENLNEHVLGDGWPIYEDRRAMLVEAIEIMRGLWDGDLFSYRGEYYTVENARLYTLPAEPVRIMVAAGGPESAELAGELGDGFIGTSPEAEVVKTFRSSGGEGKPTYGQVTLCWAKTKDEGAKTLHKIWRSAGVPGDLSYELPLPRHFEQASELVAPKKLAETMPVGPKVDRYVEVIQQYVDAGYDHVYLHQVGPDQEGFFRFWRDELQPALAKAGSREPIAVG